MANELTKTYSVDDVRTMAKAMVESRLFPVKNEAEAFTMMMICQAEGCHPMKAMQRYHIIQGKPAKNANAMLADFQLAGGRVKWIKRTDEICEAEFFSPALDGSLTVKWTIEQAQRAGLTGKQTWKHYPRQMLSARVVSEGVGMAWAGASGLYTPEEVQEFDAKPGNVLDDMAKRAQPVNQAIETTAEPVEDDEDEPSSDEPGENDVECYVWQRKTKDAEGNFRSIGYKEKRTDAQNAKLHATLHELAQLSTPAIADKYHRERMLKKYNKDSSAELSKSECADHIDWLEKQVRRGQEAKGHSAELAEDVGREPGQEG